MISQTVNRILSAETAAAEKIDAANKTAEQMLDKASRRAKEILQETDREISLQNANAQLASRNETQEVLENGRLTSAEADAIRKKADEKRASSVESIIKTLTKQQDVF